MVFLTLFAIGCAAWLVFGELSGAYTPAILERSVVGDFFTTVLVLTVTAVMVRSMSEALFQSNRQLREELKERKLAEAQREEMIKELEAKNSELERFTYTVSHDLKSPLVTINGFLGYLETDTVSGNIERVKQDTHRIQEAVNKMHMLLNELLELSRIGRIMNPPENIPFEELALEAINTLHGQIEKRNIKVSVESNLSSVYGDRQRLTEILQNLIENSAKYSHKQVEPRMEIGQVEGENGNPIFYVRDNGIGIESEYHERIFGLFNQLDPTKDGNGIGLTLVRRIIEVHGG
jgi:signal transduction histidine kinase